MLSLPFKSISLDAPHTIRESGTSKLVCETHSRVLGFMHVFDHSFFAITNDHGVFTILNVPPAVTLSTPGMKKPG